jgi:hypothetical protein
MKCPDRATIQKYADSEIMEIDIQGIRTHISQCPACKKLLLGVIKDRELVKRSLARLNPETTDPGEFKVSTRRIGTTKIDPFFKRLMISSIRIPIPLVIAVFIIFIYFALSVINTRIDDSQAQIRSLDSKKGTTLYLTGIDSVQAIDLKTDLSNYTLVESPSMFILKEKSHEELLH